MTLKAIMVLRGLVIEWVSVKGYDEDFVTESGKVWVCVYVHVGERERASKQTPAILLLVN